MLLTQYKQTREAKQSSLIDFFLDVERSPSNISATEKSSFLTLLLDDLQKEQWTEETKTRALSVIRILGRDPSGSDPIFSSKGFSTLLELSGFSEVSKYNDTISNREALKCIANSLFLKKETKVYLENQQVLLRCQSILQSSEHLSIDTQFLICRILFFLTINRADLVDKLVQFDVGTSIEKVLTVNVSCLVDESSRAQISQNTPINSYTVISEALKLLFNLLVTGSKREEHSEDFANAFKSCLVPILRLLIQVPFAQPQPLVPPHSQAIHALMQYPYSLIADVWVEQTEWASELYDSKEDAGSLVYITEKLLGAFDGSIRSLIPSGYPDEDGNKQIDAALAPLLLVFVSFSDNNTALRAILSKHMLPSDDDRLKPVHEGSALSAYIIRLLTSTMLPQSRDATGELLFSLCDRNASKLTQQIGYGNAAGFLVNKGIAMEPPVGENQEAAEINPITGQFVSSVPEPDLKDMTDEEKEREAERLFVLFERLKKTGIIDVENPIAKAMQESQGRFEEVNDSDSDND